VTTAAHRQIDRVRRFGRFYTRFLGVLNEGLLDSSFPLPEARLLYEIAHHEQTTASELADELGLDRGYVSRLIRKLHEMALVDKAPCDEDGRVTLLTLTDAGQTTFAKLNAAARAQVETALQPLSEADRERLVEAMGTIERLLGARPEPGVPYILRPHQPGDMGWVVERHGVLYNREHGWDETFEALVAEIVAGFVKNHDPRRERCWIAERHEANVGSVFLMKKSETVAQLRLLLVEPGARGLGIGKRLVAECTRFARRVGYARIVLWTNAGLDAARHLYEREGYRLVREEPHHSFGRDLVGQHWELEL
jgi:DNA-binding MarR family transcriptional regulator/GNAT superfamily N-acetyltransferase